MVVDLTSDEFDAYLYMVGPGFEEAISDDDSGGAAGDCTGVTDDELAGALWDIVPAGTLRTGDEVEESLTAITVLPDGSPARAWVVAGDPGEVVVVDLISEAFDAFLYVAVSEGAYAYDDDSGGRCHSRLVVTLEDPEARVVASSLGGTGPFRLRISNEPGPRTVTGECTGVPSDSARQGIGPG